MSTNRKLCLFLGTIIGSVGVVSVAMADDECEAARDAITMWNQSFQCALGQTVCSNDAYPDLIHNEACESMCSDLHPSLHTCQSVCMDAIEDGCAGAWCNFTCDGGNSNPIVPPPGPTSGCGYVDGDRCPVGTYCDNSGGCSDCTPCEYGTYNHTTGACACAPCPYYYYSGGHRVQADPDTRDEGTVWGSGNCFIPSGVYNLSGFSNNDYGLTDNKGYYNAVKFNNNCYAGS